MSIKVMEGHYGAKNLKVAIIIARFNDFISNKLLEGSIDTFVRHEGEQSNLNGDQSSWSI